MDSATTIKNEAKPKSHMSRNKKNQKMIDPKDQADLDNHANQLNPNNDEYAGNDDHDYDNDNHSNQLNPNNDEYAGD